MQIVELLLSVIILLGIWAARVSMLVILSAHQKQIKPVYMDILTTYLIEERQLLAFLEMKKIMLLQMESM